MSPSSSVIAPVPVHTRLHLSENPYGPSPCAIDAAADVLRQLHRYPDPSYRDLIDEIARHHATDPARIMVGNGTDELILMLALSCGAGDRRAIVTDSTFQSYPKSLRAVGFSVAEYPLTDYAVPVDSLIEGFRQGAGLAFVCNPHNPTGSVLSAPDLRRLCAAAVEHDVLLILDEAYAEFADEDCFTSGVPAAIDTPAVCVLRTLSKAYGLAALRVGYAVGDPHVIARLTHLQRAFPFHVNRMAQAAAIQALRDQDHLSVVIGKNRRARDVLCQGLARLGISHLPSQTNFVLARLPGVAARVARALKAEAGTLVRETSDMGLPGHIRVSVGTADQMQTFISDLAQIMTMIHSRLGELSHDGRTGVIQWDDCVGRDFGGIRTRSPA